jgi:folate-binding protein YgfZ
MFKVTPNSYFSALELIGPDASKTLQGQLTNDVENLRDHSGLNGLLCNIKGRIELVVKVYKHSREHLTLVAPRANIEAMTRRLAPYVAFSKSRLNERDLQSHSLVFGATAGDSCKSATSIWFDDFALLNPQELHDVTVPLRSSSIDEFHQYRMNSGMVQLTPAQSGLYTPQSLSLDRLGYVSFKKGCYMGQEIIARMHYKGQSKYQLALLQGLPGISAESKITLQTGAAVGTIVDATASASGYYLASLRSPPEGELHYFVNDQAVEFVKLFGDNTQ